MFYDKNLVAQIYALTRLTRLDRLRTAVEHLIREHDFQYFFFVLNGSVSLDGQEPLHLHNLPEEWCRFYEEQNLSNDDPLARYGLNQALPLDWRTLMEKPEYDTGEQRRVMILRAQHGLHHGCVIPLYAGNLGGLLNLTAREDTASDHIRQFLPYAMLLGHTIMERSRALRNQAQQRSGQLNIEAITPLNNRERECLVWASEGNTNKEIGKRLGITERTVVYHIGNACRKLHARNRQHAVTRAILTQQLPLEGIK